MELIKKYIKKCKSVLKDLRARYYLTRHHAQGHEKIRVAFIVQMPEIWNKISPVFEKMCNDDSFYPFLIVVPSFNIVTKDFNSFGYELQYFKKLYENIDVFEFDQININELICDYVFLQRPYDDYLPKGLKAIDLVKITKVCYIPYGYAPSKVFYDMNTDKEFFRNVYFFFTDSEEVLSIIKQKFKYNDLNQIQHFEFYGYPACESSLLTQVKEFDKQKPTITWTPRWSTDEIIGGSTFLKYKENMLDLKEKNDIDLIFRPHPLMFDNFIREGIMTKGEVDTYLDEMCRLGISYDSQSDISVVLNKTDILISDLSSIINEFFLTGKPIIYTSGMNFEFTDYFKHILENEYCADNFSEVEDICKTLLKKSDSKLIERMKYIEQLKKVHIGASSRIVSAIKEDFLNH